MMKKTLTERFADYLSDVISYYKKHKSLRNFSDIAKKHRITSITQELFYEYKLNDYPENKKPSIELCDEILSQIRLRREPQNKKVYDKGEVIVWEADNKERSIAYFGEKDWAWFILNYRFRPDERNRIWDYDSVHPYVVNGTFKRVRPTTKDYERFIEALAGELDFIKQKIAEKIDNEYGK
jgi:hypothetical protein